MPRFDLSTKFSILDTVFIPAISCTALILAIKYDGVGVAYEVEYWWEGSLRSLWLYEFDLKEAKNGA